MAAADTPPADATEPTVTAFEGTRRIATGSLAHVVRKAKAVVDRGERARVVLFDDATGEVVDVDFRGSAATALERLAGRVGAGRTGAPPGEAGDAGPRGPGRPKLGVVAREVTLLPRHWDWLTAQPGGASVALRKLVDDARVAHAGRDRARRARDSAYRFMSEMAGDWPGFEEATRALFAPDPSRFAAITRAWPAGVHDHLARLAASAFDSAPAPTTS